MRFQEHKVALVALFGALLGFASVAEGQPTPAPNPPAPSSSAIPSAPKPQATPRSPKVLIPFYVYPSGASDECNASEYEALFKSKLIRYAYVVINPNSGPVDSGSPNFKRFESCAQRVTSAGGRALGYVKSKVTSNPDAGVYIQTGLRPLAEISADLAIWRQFPIDGIFVDEVTGVANPTFGDHARHLTHYREIRQRIAKENPNWRVWLNAGGAIRAEYLKGPMKAGDGAVIFEHLASFWNTNCGKWNEGPWCPYQSAGDGVDPLLSAIQDKSIAPNQLAALLYAGELNQLDSIVSAAQKSGVGLVYVTPDRNADPWNRPPDPALYPALEKALGL